MQQPHRGSRDRTERGLRLTAIHVLKRPKGEKLNLGGTFQDRAVTKLMNNDSEGGRGAVSCTCPPTGERRPHCSTAGPRGVRGWTGLEQRPGEESRKGERRRAHTRMLGGQAASPQEKLRRAGMKELGGIRGSPERGKGKKLKGYEATSCPDTPGRSPPQRQTGPVSVQLVFLAHVFRLLNGLRGARRSPRLAHVPPAPPPPGAAAPTCLPYPLPHE